MSASGPRICYLFGYGLDYKDYFRNVAGIYAVAHEDV